MYFMGYSKIVEKRRAKISFWKGGNMIFKFGWVSYILEWMFYIL